MRGDEEEGRNESENILGPRNFPLLHNSSKGSEYLKMHEFMKEET